ncbi:MAG TPA: PAS domain-containing sensor histidine kinase, partial [Algoriphagus sp.]|nr:PAS domain-containing sensor histidine kinase [Algoriphagus sp.]
MNMEKVKDKIFKMNQTFHGHSEAKGIGLYLVNSHLQSAGGSIEVESEEGVGTTFKVIF